MIIFYFFFFLFLISRIIFSSWKKYLTNREEFIYSKYYFFGIFKEYILLEFQLQNLFTS